jgi:predicted membrane protein
MIRFITVLILTAIASYAAIYVAPWWIPMIIAFIIILLLPLKSGKAFLAPALGTAVAYLIMSLQTDIANSHLLSTKMAMLFFHMASPALMLLATALVGFITAGLGGWAAASLIALKNKEVHKPVE